ncbi:MAG: type IV pilus modification PilV family protein [Candidatus Xenobia bacterium]
MMRSRGLSLVEAVIGFALLMPVTVAIIGLFPLSYDLTASAWQQRDAQTVARTHLDALRDLPFATIPAQLSGCDARNGVTYQWSVTVTAPPAGDDPTLLKTVHMAITWPQGQTTYDTMIGREATP